MRKYIIFSLIIVSFLLAVPSPVTAGTDYGKPSPPLCLPGVYTGLESGCSPLGPMQYLTEMAAQGFFFPPLPLSAFKPDPALNQIDYRYAVVTKDRAPIYQTLDAAINNNSKFIARRIAPGFNYVSYTDVAVAGSKRFFHTEKGWISSDHVSPSTTSQFQGLEFPQTPATPFGWVLNYFSATEKVAVKHTPGYEEDDYTGRSVEHLDLIQIYETKEINDWYWYKIAPGEWIFQTAIAKVTPNTTPPAGVNSDRWIEINLYEQTISVYENRELIFATLVATGTAPTWTYPGLFQIYEKLPVTDMRGGTKAEGNVYYLENVPWTMYFDDRRALHGAYWRPMLGFPQSHGCVNLSVGDAHWLYNWAELGDWVYVWDPTGKTPLEDEG
ncbi:MAG: hypothetical protein B6243_04215 [Anaerolineaceae bacterium 4572_5.2]|nr:MAG: hypothetical protein B6243_04215 [Anaerolineaceae bacterium 4572_5.2]